MSINSHIVISPEAQAFEDFLQETASPHDELASTRAQFEAIHHASTEPEEVTYRTIDVNGVPGIWVQPATANTDFVLVHAHAGGSVVTSANVDRKLAGHIAKAIGVSALVLDYHRAPEHKYPAQVDDMETAFNWLLGQGYEAKNIILGGHSIGGFLSIATALRLRDAGGPTPGVVVSISPWADLQIANKTIESKADTDKVLSRQLLEFFRDAWIGETGIAFDDVRINLNLADLRGLPPTLVSWGTYEILAGEDEELSERLASAGVDTVALPIEGAQHSYVWAAGRVPETDTAIVKIANWVRSKLPIETR